MPQGNVELVVRSDAADPQVMNGALVLDRDELVLRDDGLGFDGGVLVSRLGAWKRQHPVVFGNVESAVLGETDPAWQLLCDRSAQIRDLLRDTLRGQRHGVNLRSQRADKNHLAMRSHGDVPRCGTRA